VRRSNRQSLALSILFGILIGCLLWIGTHPAKGAMAPNHNMPRTSTPTKIKIITRIYPDLHKRELSSKKPSWQHLRKMAARRWDDQHPAARRAAEKAALLAQIPHYSEWVCISGHESHGKWDTSTGNGYYGGLQMDRGFQQTYAPSLYRTKGTADRWTPEEQMVAAEGAWRGRGFTPWPNTARMCGLL